MSDKTTHIDVIIGLFFSFNSILYEEGLFWIVWGIIGAVLIGLKIRQIERNKELEIIRRLHTQAELCHDAHR